MERDLLSIESEAVWHPVPFGAAAQHSPKLTNHHQRLSTLSPAAAASSLGRFITNS